MAEVEVIVESLWELDEDQLEAQIGSRAQAIEDDVAGHSLWELEGAQLEAQIGSRAQAIEDDVAGHGTRGVDPASLESIDVNIAARAPIDPRFLEAGRQLFDRINPLAYELMCKPLGDNADTQKILDEIINQNYTKAAGMLAPVLVNGLVLAPAVATFLATLIIKKIANMGATAICETWEKSLVKPAI